VKGEIGMIDLRESVRTAGFAAAIAAGSLGMVLGVGAGTAGAAPPSPAGNGMDFSQDRGWGNDWRDDRGRHGGDHRRDDGRRPGLHINLPCVTGPYGVVTWCP
jgi:hypothetical protein